jgi:hypothetical protein
MRHRHDNAPFHECAPTIEAAAKTHRLRPVIRDAMLRLHNEAATIAHRYDCTLCGLAVKRYVYGAVKGIADPSSLLPWPFLIGVFFDANHRHSNKNAAYGGERQEKL